MIKQILKNFYKKDELFQFMNHLTDTLLVVNSLGKILYINHSAENIFAVKKDEVTNKNIDVLIREAQKNNEEHIGIKENSEYFPIYLQKYPIIIEGQSYQIILVVNKHQYYKRKEIEELRKTLADLQLVLDASSIVSIADSEGVITNVNKKFCELSKYKEDEVIGQTHRILHSGYHSREFFAEMWQRISSGEIWRGEIQNKAKDSSLYWVNTTIVPFISDDGKPYKYVSVQTDITKRVQMEKKYQEKLRGDFLDTIENLQNGIFKLKKDEKGNLFYTMAAGKLLAEIGANSSKLNNRTPFEVFPKEIAYIKEEHYKLAFEGKRVNYEIELEGKLVHVDVSPIYHGDTVTEIVGSVHDISELRSTQKELQVNQEQFQSLLKYSQDFIIIFDANGQIIDMNPKTVEFFGFSNKKISNIRLGDFNLKDYVGSVREFFQKALLGSIQYFEIEVFNKVGEKTYFNITLLPIIIDNKIKGVYLIGKDITEQKKTQEMNAYLAHHDELTGLPNRRWMEKKLKESIEGVKKNNLKTAILLLDIDRFKHINDTLGHLIGDQLLQQIAIRLQINNIKDKQIAFRMGGDEFMILCHAVESYEEVTRVAENILQGFVDPFYIEEYELFVTASIGISFYPCAGENGMELMKKADIALYKAKELGRNMYQVYEQSMSNKNFNAFFLERDLRKASINNEFVAHFQPRVDAITGKTISAEALIRWKHPERGLVSPGEFIPLAEDTGLIIPMGKWMKRKVCEQLNAWKEAGIPLIPISVNISSQRFLQKNFASDMKSLLAEFNLEGKWLEIEITENSLMKNEEYILQTLRELKEMGVKIYIDDFGTGYSSFNYLKTFNIDGVKIDRSFIQNISAHSENASITTAMIQVAQHLQMDVIAEGVETKEELDYLLEQNCHHVQGFYFGKPCPIEEFEKKYLFNQKN